MAADRRALAVKQLDTAGYSPNLSALNGLNRFTFKSPPPAQADENANTPLNAAAGHHNHQGGSGKAQPLAIQRPPLQDSNPFQLSPSRSSGGGGRARANSLPACGGFPVGLYSQLPGASSAGSHDENVPQPSPPLHNRRATGHSMSRSNSSSTSSTSSSSSGGAQAKQPPLREKGVSMLVYCSSTSTTDGAAEEEEFDLHSPPRRLHKRSQSNDSLGAAPHNDVFMSATPQPEGNVRPASAPSVKATPKDELSTLREEEAVTEDEAADDEQPRSLSVDAGTLHAQTCATSVMMQQPRSQLPLPVQPVFVTGNPLHRSQSLYSVARSPRAEDLRCTKRVCVDGNSYNTGFSRSNSSNAKNVLLADVGASAQASGQLSHMTMLPPQQLQQQQQQQHRQQPQDSDDEPPPPLAFPRLYGRSASVSLPTRPAQASVASAASTVFGFAATAAKSTLNLAGPPPSVFTSSAFMPTAARKLDVSDPNFFDSPPSLSSALAASTPSPITMAVVEETSAPTSAAVSMQSSPLVHQQQTSDDQACLLARCRSLVGDEYVPDSPDTDTAAMQHVPQITVDNPDSPSADGNGASLNMSAASDASSQGSLERYDVDTSLSHELKPLPVPDPEIRSLPVEGHEHWMSKAIRLISAETLARLLRGEFADRFDRYIIIDARFPYEFKGGCIIGAINRYQHKYLLPTFLTHTAPMPQLPAGNRVAIIFHCEFSSHRAPTQHEFLRMIDEEITQGQGDRLFPEMYVLKDGYKGFFTKFPELCTPSSYRTMKERGFEQECRSEEIALAYDRSQPFSYWQEHQTVASLRMRVSQHGVSGLQAATPPHHVYHPHHQRHASSDEHVSAGGVLLPSMPHDGLPGLSSAAVPAHLRTPMHALYAAAVCTPVAQTAPNH